MDGWRRGDDHWERGRLTSSPPSASDSCPACATIYEGHSFVGDLREGDKTTGPAARLTCEISDGHNKEERRRGALLTYYYWSPQADKAPSFQTKNVRWFAFWGLRAKNGKDNGPQKGIRGLSCL